MGASKPETPSYVGQAYKAPYRLSDTRSSYSLQMVRKRGDKGASSRLLAQVS